MQGVGQYISFAWAAIIKDWVAKTREIYFLTVLEFWRLEVQSPKSVDLVSSEVSLLSLQMATLSSRPLMVISWSVCESPLVRTPAKSD